METSVAWSYKLNMASHTAMYNVVCSTEGKIQCVCVSRILEKKIGASSISRCYLLTLWRTYLFEKVIVT